MAISDTKKLDYLWKKLGYGVSATDGANKKSASNESISSPLLLRGDRIWVKSEEIPAVIPTTSSEFVQVHHDSISTTVECEMDVTATPLRTWKTSLEDWVPAEFGPTYQVKVYVDFPGAGEPQTTGTRLYSDGTGSDEWFFDYASGILHFIGEALPTSVVNGKKIYVTGARYVGPTGLSNFTTGGSVSAGIYPESQTFVGDGDTVDFALSYAPSSTFAIDVYVYDVLQRPHEIYTVVGNTLHFMQIPPVDADIFVTYRAPFSTSTNYPNQSIENRHLNLSYTSDQYNADGSQTVYDINSGHTAHSVLVIVDGLILPPTKYTVNGTVLHLTESPASGQVVDIRYMPV
jgi:hypothetical protein